MPVHGVAVDEVTGSSNPSWSIGSEEQAFLPSIATPNRQEENLNTPEKTNNYSSHSAAAARHQVEPVKIRIKYLSYYNANSTNRYLTVPRDSGVRKHFCSIYHLRYVTV